MFDQNAMPLTQAQLEAIEKAINEGRQKARYEVESLLAEVLRSRHSKR